MEFRYYKIESKQHDDVRIYDPDGNLLSNVISCDIHMEAGDLHSATIKILNTKEKILVPEHKVNIKKKSIYEYLVIKKDNLYDPAYIYKFCKDINSAFSVLDNVIIEAESEGVFGINKKGYDIIEITTMDRRIITYQIVAIHEETLDKRV